MERDTNKDWKVEYEEMKARLEEVEETLNAIRTGQVDALVVENGHGHQLYTLKSADQTYRVFIEKMKEGAVTLDRNETILYSNSQFAMMVGLSLPEVIGKSFRSFVPKECREEYRKLMESGWNSDSKGELPIYRFDGVQVPFLLSFTTLDLDEGCALSIILTDLTAQKKAEHELVEKNLQLTEARNRATQMNAELEEQVRLRTNDLLISREHFKFLADNIPVMVWTANANGDGVYYNQKWFEYTGIPFDSERNSWNDFIHPDDNELVRQAWAKSVAEGKSFTAQFRLLRALDGEYRWHQSKGEPFFDDNGHLAGWLGTVIDVEEQRKELDRKDEFIGVASHELKTPLTSLKGYLQLIGEHPQLPQGIRSFVWKANSSMIKLQNLINDLLDVSKINAGRLQFSRGRLDLSVLVAASVENAEAIYTSHRFIRTIKPGVYIEGNEERIDQVVMNLISNAVKYSPEKKDIRITVESDEENAFVRVLDEGIGLTTQNQQKIFDRFFRVEDRKFQASGLGMGLFIASQIIKEHGGMMGVNSRLNDGSEFFFQIPLVVS
jgi:two-component system CheB/CheR fusion protein